MKQKTIIITFILFIIILILILFYFKYLHSLNCDEDEAGLTKWAEYGHRIIIYKCVPDPNDCLSRDQLNCEKDNECISSFKSSCKFCEDIMFYGCVPIENI